MSIIVRARTLGLSCLAMVAALTASGCDADAGDSAAPDALPDLGANVTGITPTMSVADIKAKLRALAAQSTGFDESRTAVLFMPGA